MTDFTSVKKYLQEIIEIEPDLFNESLTRPIKSSSTIFFYDDQIQKIYSTLIEAPKGKSINKKGIPRLIVLSILVLDELIFFKDDFRWNKYIEFRYKAFSLFDKNDFDGEASELFKNLIEIKYRLNNRPELKKKLDYQEKIYKRKISRKIKELETCKQFDKAGLLNSMYGTVPGYIYELRIEEKEKKHFEWHFLEPVYKIVVEVLFFLFVFGINQMVIKKFKSGDLFAYFAKGSFDIYELLYGFALIFLMFWLFKLLDHQRIKNLYRNIIKGLLIIAALVIIDMFIITKYKSERERYFPNEYDERVMSGEYKDDTVRVLVTKFTPLEKTTIFNRDYTDINASKLFYKKLLELKKSSNPQGKDKIVIDYDDSPLEIESEGDFERIYEQKKYDFVIGGDLHKAGDKLCVLNSCYIIDTGYTNLIQNWNDRLLDGEMINNNLRNDSSTFFKFYNDPVTYYREVTYFPRDNDSSDVPMDDRLPGHYVLPYSLQKYNIASFRSLVNIPNSDFSFISSMEKSPAIAYHYINFLKQWNIYKKNESNTKLADSIIIDLDQISTICDDSVSSLSNNIQFSIFVLCLKTYFINQRIKYETNKTEKNYLWTIKTETVEKSLRKILKLSKYDPFDIQYIISSLWFCSYIKALRFRLYSPNDISVHILKPFRKKLMLNEDYTKYEPVYVGMYLYLDYLRTVKIQNSLKGKVQQEQQKKDSIYLIKIRNAFRERLNKSEYKKFDPFLMDDLFPESDSLESNKLIINIFRNENNVSNDSIN
jgi:hypothetical protein